MLHTITFIERITEMNDSHEVDPNEGTGITMCPCHVTGRKCCQVNSRSDATWAPLSPSPLQLINELNLKYMARADT